jgi:hypothetical protein
MVKPDGATAASMTDAKENRTLAGPVAVCRREASNHLPEGNSCRRGDCHLGEEQALADNESQYAHAPISRNAKARMPAMQRSQRP